jgi:flagellum-specific ATP synthase
MGKVVSNEHKIVSAHLRDLIAAYKESEDLINVGAYARGTNPKVDKAIIIYDELMQFTTPACRRSKYTIDDLI